MRQIDMTHSAVPSSFSKLSQNLMFCDCGQVGGLLPSRPGRFHIPSLALCSCRECPIACFKSAISNSWQPRRSLEPAVEEVES